jgi:hypothetical protein
MGTWRLSCTRPTERRLTCACVSRLAAAGSPDHPPPEREQPSRSLFCRGLAAEVTTDALRQLFSTFGDLRDVYNLADRKGIAFIEFVRTPTPKCPLPKGAAVADRCAPWGGQYDLRAAEAARYGLNDAMLHGRKVRRYLSRYGLAVAEPARRG